MRFLNSRLLVRWAILGLILAMGSSAEICLITDPNEISQDNHLNDITLRGMETAARPQWSPDEQYIIFTNGGGLNDDIFPARPDEITGEIYRAASDGSDLQRILASGDPDEIVHSPIISPDGTRIVYVTTWHKVSEEESRESVHNRRNFEIETSLLDGTDRRRLTEDYMQDVLPLWSPDGSSIAFIRTVPGGWPPGTPGIYTMAVDGSEQELIFPQEPANLAALCDMDPIFTYGDPIVLQRTLPDGVSTVPDNLALAEGSGRLAGPTWSPDGSRMAFIAQIGCKLVNSDDGTTPYLTIHGPPTLYTANADGSDLTPVFSSSTVIIDNRFHTADPIADRPHRGASPVWSPDGKKIAFLRYVDNNLLDDLAEDQHVTGNPGLGLYEIGADGSGLREIAIIDDTYKRRTGELSWSPDGKLLLMSTIGETSRRGSIPSEIHVIPVDGSAQRLTAIGLDASWSPDGSRIAVSDSSSPNEYPLYRVDRLYTMAPDGTDIQWIVERDEDGELRAVNPPADEESCFLFFCG